MTDSVYRRRLRRECSHCEIMAIETYCFVCEREMLPVGVTYVRSEADGSVYAEQRAVLT